MTAVVSMSRPGSDTDTSRSRSRDPLRVEPVRVLSGTSKLLRGSLWVCLDGLPLRREGAGVSTGDESGVGVGRGARSAGTPVPPTYADAFPTPQARDPDPRRSISYFRRGQGVGPVPGETQMCPRRRVEEDGEP